MDPVELFILDLEAPQRDVFEYLHDLILSNYPELTPKIRYKIPFYYRKSWICYLNPTKNGRVELAFLRGHELSNEQGLLQARNRKLVRGITFDSTISIPEEDLHEIIQEALLLDEEIAHASKHKKSK